MTDQKFRILRRSSTEYAVQVRFLYFFWRFIKKGDYYVDAGLKESHKTVIMPSFGAADTIARTFLHNKEKKKKWQLVDYETIHKEETGANHDL